MWSGPRNISTALMRSWGAREDTFVTDEPLYAYYLRATGTQHPDRDRIIAAHESDWRKVVAALIDDVPAGKAVHYQKHMAHHLLPELYGPWLEDVTHAFLIRHPEEMVPSLAGIMDRPGLEDTGLPQQYELYDHVTEKLGQTPPIIDGRDVLERPAAMLEKLCGALDVPYTESMLSWKAGPRETDGTWAEHWYGRVETSTGFRPYAPREEPVPAAQRDLVEACLPYYRRLHELRIRP